MVLQSSKCNKPRGNLRKKKIRTGSPLKGKEILIEGVTVRPSEKLSVTIQGIFLKILGTIFTNFHS